MGIFRKKVINYEIEKGTIFIVATKKQLRSISPLTTLNDLEKLRIIHEAEEEMTIRIDPKKVNIFMTFKDGHLKCEIFHKNYRGSAQNIPDNYLRGRTKLGALHSVFSAYLILTTLDLEQGKIYHKISEDLRRCSSDSNLVVSTDMEITGECDIVKFQYKYENNKLSLEKLEDYYLYGNRNIQIKIGEVYVVKYEDSSCIYSGTNTGTIITSLDLIHKGIIHKTLTEEGLCCS